MDDAHPTGGCVSLGVGVSLCWLGKGGGWRACGALWLGPFCHKYAKVFRKGRQSRLKEALAGCMGGGSAPLFHWLSLVKSVCTNFQSILVFFQSKCDFVQLRLAVTYYHFPDASLHYRGVLSRKGLYSKIPYKPVKTQISKESRNAVWMLRLVAKNPKNKHSDQRQSKTTSHTRVASLTLCVWVASLLFRRSFSEQKSLCVSHSPLSSQRCLV